MRHRSAGKHFSSLHVFYGIDSAGVLRAATRGPQNMCAWCLYTRRRFERTHGRGRGREEDKDTAMKAKRSLRRFSSRIWMLPTAGRFGFGESDGAKAVLGSELIGDLPFSSASLGSLRLHDHVTFTVRHVLEAVDLVAQR